VNAKGPCQKSSICNYRSLFVIGGGGVWRHLACSFYAIADVWRIEGRFCNVKICTISLCKVLFVVIISSEKEPNSSAFDIIVRTVSFQHLMFHN
jgi:hypothetical protein